MDDRYGRLNFKITKQEFDALDEVIERLSYESKTAWLKAHLRADLLLCGMIELSDPEKALLSVGGNER